MDVTDIRADITYLVDVRGHDVPMHLDPINPASGNDADQEVRMLIVEADGYTKPYPELGVGICLEVHIDSVRGIWPDPEFNQTTLPELAVELLEMIADANPQFERASDIAALLRREGWSLTTTDEVEELLSKLYLLGFVHQYSTAQPYALTKQGLGFINLERSRIDQIEMDQRQQLEQAAKATGTSIAGVILS